MAVLVETEVPPTKTTPAVIEPRIGTEGEIHSPDVPQAFTRIIIARTVCTWSAANSTAVLQIANPSNHHVKLNRNAILGYITPAQEKQPATVSEIADKHTAAKQNAREE